MLVLLGVWFLPLPDPIFGSEQLSATRMPDTRAKANAAIAKFQQAKKAYYDFIQSHDMAVISTTIRSDIAQLKAAPGDMSKRAALRDQAVQVRDYTSALYNYGKAGDDLFPVLRFYDDELMAYTRSVTPPTDEVRAWTYPLADILRLYPPPVGDLMPDPPWIKADAIKGQLDALNSHIAALNPAANPATAGDNSAQLADAISQDVKNIWESGRSVEEVGFQHTKYLERLLTYDSKIQGFIQSGGGTTSTLTSGRKALAMGLNVLAGLLLAAGVAFLLLPRRPRLRPARREPGA